MERLLRNRKAICVFIFPALLLYTFIVFIPILWSAVYTLFDGLPGLNFKFVGLENFQNIAADTKFWSYFVTNLKYVLVTVLGQITFGLGAAFLIIFCIKKNKNLVRILLFIPVILPSVAVAQLFVKIYEIAPQYGLINSFLELVGLGAWIKAWLGEVSTALWAICAMDIWRAIGLYALIFYSGLLDVPEDVLEAAKIDGASKGRLITSVYLPLIKPILCVGTVLSLTGTFKVYESVLALTKGGPGTSTYVLSMYMYDTAFKYQQYGYGSVIAVVILAECLLASGIVNKIFMKDNTGGK